MKRSAALLVTLVALSLGGCCSPWLEYHNDNGARGREDLVLGGRGSCAPAREPPLAPVK